MWTQVVPQKHFVLNCFREFNLETVSQCENPVYENLCSPITSTHMRACCVILISEVIFRYTYLWTHKQLEMDTQEGYEQNLHNLATRTYTCIQSHTLLPNPTYPTIFICDSKTNLYFFWIRSCSCNVQCFRMHPVHGDSSVNLHPLLHALFTQMYKVVHATIEHFKKAKAFCYHY